MKFLWYMGKQFFWILAWVCLFALFIWANQWLSSKFDNLGGYCLLVFFVVAWTACSWGDYTKERDAKAHEERRRGKQ